MPACVHSRPRQNPETVSLFTTLAWSWDTETKADAAKAREALVGGDFAIKGRDAKSVQSELQGLLAKTGAHISDIVRVRPRRPSPPAPLSPRAAHRLTACPS